MKAVLNLAVALTVALVANTGFAKDEVVPSAKPSDKKFAGIITLQHDNKVHAFGVGFSHKELLTTVKIISEKIAAGKIKEDDKEAVELTETLKQLAGLVPAKDAAKAQIAEDVVAIGTSAVAIEKTPVIASDKGDKACWGWGYRCRVRYWGGCYPCGYNPCYYQQPFYCGYSYGYSYNTCGYGYGYGGYYGYGGVGYCGGVW